jgi:hypothetical protein
MLKLKSLIKEGFAWERKADGSLPTLKDAIAVHEANQAQSPQYKVAGREVTINKNGSDDQTKWEVTFKDSKKTVPYSDVISNIKPRPKMNEPRWQDSDGDGKWYEPGQDVKKVNEYGEDEFDRSSQMYSGGKSSRDGKDILDLVSHAEDLVQNLRSNMATNSVLQREEKMGYLRAYDELLDILSDIGFQAEME